MTRSTIATDSESHPFRILIVGAGIAGLSTFLALSRNLPSGSHRQRKTTISVLEATSRHTDDTDFNAGGGLGLAPNGLRALSRITPECSDEVVKVGCPVDGFEFKNSSGRTLGVFRGWKKDRYGEGKGRWDMTMMRRQDLYEILRKKVIDEAPDAIEYGKRIVSVTERTDNEEPSSIVYRPVVHIEFSDGTSRECDLLIGADGIHSAVRSSVFGAKYAPQYEGLSNLGGFVPPSVLQRVSDSLASSQSRCVMTFGPNGFFGYALATAPESGNIMWWSTFPSDEPLVKSTPFAQVRSAFVERCAGWSDIIRSIAESVEESLFIPTFSIPPLERWHSDSGRVVLVGDAAHAVPPDAGQGASQALEDAILLALLLSKSLKSTSDDASIAQETTEEKDHVLEATQKYSSLRIPRLARVLAFARSNGDAKREKSMTRLQCAIRDTFLWVLLRVMPYRAMDWLYGWDVMDELEK